MLEKIRIKDIATQLGVPNKEITEMLSRYFEGAKTLNSVLSETELDVIFEHYSHKRSVESFDAYFALAEQRPKKPEPKPETKQPAKPVAKPLTKPVNQQPQGAKKRPTKEERLASEQLAQAAKQLKQQEDAAAAQGAQQPAPLPQKPKKEGTPQARTKGEARTVDTRSGNVDLEKYNERYEQIAPGQQQGRRRAPRGTKPRPSACAVLPLSEQKSPSWLSKWAMKSW